LLWTPGYWGFVGGVYRFNVGYWGPHVGYYGGVNYGFGYVGVGFAGGRWVGNSFAYNRTVVNVNVTNVHNTYNERVVNNVTVNKVSYNGGPAGTHAVPTHEEMAARNEPHVQPTQMQHQHLQEAARNPDLAARANGGHPAIAATPRAGAFHGQGVVGAHGATMSPAAAASHTQPGAPGGAPNTARGVPGAPGSAGVNGAHTPPNGTVHAGQPGAGQPKPGAKPAKPAPRPKPEKKRDNDK
jgi:hypothetical protein